MKISERQIVGKGRTMDVALARQVAMYLSRELTGASYINIGMHMGGRDHSTVIHAYKTIENKLAAEPDFGRKLENLKSEIAGHKLIFNK